MSDVPTVKELTKLRVVDLKQRLASLGISTSGLKADLVKRLHEALMAQEGQESEFGDFQEDLPNEEYNPPQIFQQQQPEPQQHIIQEQQQVPQHEPDPVDKDKELFEQQKEALAFEQVRLLEEEKSRQDIQRIELGRQQQQMLVDRDKQQQQQLTQQDVEMIERGKQQQQILLEMKKNEELAREHRERMLAETQQRMLAQQLQQQEEGERMIQQQQLEERQSFVSMQQPPVQVSLAGPFNTMLSNSENIGHPGESVSAPQIVPIEPAMTANIAAATQVARRIPHSGPQSMIIPLNPVMTSSGVAQPVTTMASFLRATQASLVVGSSIDTPPTSQQVNLVRTMPNEPTMQVPVIQAQLISTPSTVTTTVSSVVSLPTTMANVINRTSVVGMGGPGPSIMPQIQAQLANHMHQPPPTISQPPPQMAQQQPLISQPPPQISQPQGLLSQPPPQINQPGLLMNQPPPQMSHQPPLITHPPPLISQPPPQMNPPSPSMGQPVPLLSQPPPQMSQQPPHFNQGQKQSQMMQMNPVPLMQPLMTPSPNNPPLIQQQMTGPSPSPMTSSQLDNAPLLPTPNIDVAAKPMVPISAPSHQAMQQNIMEPMIPHSVASMPISGQQPLMGSGPPNVIPNNNAPLLPIPPPIMSQHSKEMMPPPPPPPMMMGPPQSKPSQAPHDDFDGPLLPIPVDMQGNKIPPNSMVYGGKQDKEVAEGGASQSGEYPLPSAIEKVLALKNVRAQEVGLNADGEVAEEVKKKKTPENTPPPLMKPLVSVDEDEDEADEEEQPAVPASKQPKESKNKRKKMKKKRARQRKMEQKKTSNESREKEVEEHEDEEKTEVEIDYVPDTMEPKDPLYFQFLRIFEKFKLQEPEKPKPELTEEQLKELQRQEEIMNRLAERKKPADIDEKDDEEDDKKEEEKPKLSKRKLKKLSRMSVAELKQRVSRPELVEMHDVTAKDPVLLLHLKATRNSVPVPRHWCFKRKYLQGKRGIEKPPFLLPDFIRKTGIMEMRQALQEKEEAKTMKAKMRERVRPKMGKIDIDYQKLHDAFFKWQIKPRMTIHGDLYYEGKEFETRLKEKKPGDLSEELRIALGMPTGPNQNKCPPPWLIAMQRYGPPPSYPNLKIPGLNAPIPDGCSFGYHAGGWGKPPVDEMGRPLYGDVFNTQSGDPNYNMIDEEVDRTLWGELESESSEESEEESEEEEEEEKAEDETGLVTPAEGLVTPSGLNSVAAGMETPDMIELRKRKIEAEMEGGETPALYTILPERQQDRLGASMMGSTHIYDVTAAMPAAKARGVTGAIAGLMPPQGVEVTLDPSELEMDSAAMAARYEQTVREQQSQLAKEDLSDMVAEHAARQKNKRKKQQQQDTGKTAKKYKEFKF